MFDVDKFILCVQENTAIWCKGSEEYNDKELRDLSWDLIGRHMYQDTWTDMTDAEHRVQVRELKNKWRHIRDSFTKHLHQLKSGNYPLKKKRKYIYANALEFLVPTFDANQSRKAEGKQEAEEDDDLETTSQPEEEQEQEKEQEYIKRNTRIRIKNAEPREKENASEPKDMSRRRKQPSCSSSQSELNETSDDEDGYKLFFLSLLPDFRLLDYDQKLDFRLHILQFFHDLRQKKTSQSQTGK